MVASEGRNGRVKVWNVGLVSEVLSCCSSELILKSIVLASEEDSEVDVRENEGWRSLVPVRRRSCILN